MGTLTDYPDSDHQPPTPASVITEARGAEALHDTDRWTNEGGRVAAEESPHRDGKS
jgi:hypothetical protein